MEYIFPVILFLVGIGLILHSFRKASLLGLIEGTPTTLIGKIRGGLSEIKGRIVASVDVLDAPLAGRSCVYLHLKIQERVKRGKSSYWVDRVNETRGGRFLLDDGSGRVEVALNNATVEFETDEHRSSGFLDEAPPDFERLLQSHGLSLTGIIFNKTFKCTETILEEGDEIYLLGEPQMGGEMPFFNGSQGEVFFVSDNDEDSLISSMRNYIFVERLFAFIALAASLALYNYVLNAH